MIWPGPRTDLARSAALRRLKQRAAELWGAAEGDAVMVTELACSEPGCPPVETVIAWLRPGVAPLQVKVHRAAIDVTDEDVRRALAGAHQH